MDPIVHEPPTVRFGPFEVDLANGVLRKRGIRIRLQTQPLAVLTALLEEPGSVVTREQLHQRLWPDDTFVDFEHGLNAAVTRLRQALGDSAGRPRYIETLPKRGYRFKGQVERPVIVPANEYDPIPRSLGRRFAATAAASVLLALTILGLHLSRPNTSQVARASPLTSFPGRESDPALSPDGGSIAFSWNGEKEDNFHIYVMRIGSGAPVRLTTSPGEEVCPVWSPDGRTIAFSRASGEVGEILLVPASGGPERRIAQIRNRELGATPLARQVSTMAWSPDGSSIAASHREPSDTCERIYLFSLGGGKRALTNPQPGNHGDYMPAFSPDGRSIAFSRLSGFSAAELWVQLLDRSSQPVGQARPITHHKRWAANPAWIDQGRQLLFVFSERPDAANARELRTIDESGDPASERTIPLSEPPYQFRTAGPRLAYSTYIEEVDIWRAKIPASGEPPNTAEPLIASTRPDTKARYSPDGKQIAFVSERSGSPELWTANRDGSNPVRLTSFGGPLMGPPAWSPDGQWIAFHCRPEGQSDLFSIRASGGQPIRLTNETADDNMPAYSKDGQFIYFTSLRSGQRQIWKMPAGGGEAVQITTGGGSRPIPAPDGTTIYYASDAENSIRRVAVTGGIEREVVGPVQEAPFGIAVTGQGIYYPAPPHSGDRRYIRFFSFASGQSQPIVEIDRLVGWTLSISPDERYLLFDQWEKPKMDLLLVDNFRLPTSSVRAKFFSPITMNSR